MPPTSTKSLSPLLRRLKAAAADLDANLEVTFSNQLVALYTSLLADTAATVGALLADLTPAATRHASAALGSVAILQGMLAEANSYDGVRFRQELALAISQLQSLQRRRLGTNLVKPTGTEAAAGAQDSVPVGLVELSVEERDRVVTVSLTVVNSRGGRILYADHIPTTLTLDPVSLTMLYNASRGSGEALTEHLFADNELRHAWERAMAWGHDSLPVRLYLPIQPASLHTVPWEVLGEPGSSTPIVLNERRRFARVVDADALARRPRMHTGGHQAVVAVASPRNVRQYGLAEVDIHGEVGRAADALEMITTRILAEHPSATMRPAMLSHLLTLLRDGATILYLVCHSRGIKQMPHLCFEDARGDAHWVSADAFVKAIQQLITPPRLIVLAACGGAGDDNNIRTAIGSSLARAGVSAVIAMNGPITMRSVARLMPLFFRELLRDGQVDRALAAARNALQGDDDWWRPVLWLHAMDGAL